MTRLNGISDKQMNRGHWWNDTDSGTPNFSNCTAVHLGSPINSHDLALDRSRGSVAKRWHNGTAQ